VASAVINVAPEGNLSRYLQEIRKFPMLSPEEELRLSHAWRDSEDMESAHKLVTSHLRLVAKIAMGYRGYGLPIGELISEGNVGMMQAVKRFDPDRGFRLATYAMWWIRAAIQEYILHSWSLVKMGTTAAQKKLFFNLRRLKGQIQAIRSGLLTPAAEAPGQYGRKVRWMPTVTPAASRACTASGYTPNWLIPMDRTDSDSFQCAVVRGARLLATATGVPTGVSAASAPRA